MERNRRSRERNSRRRSFYRQKLHTTDRSRRCDGRKLRQTEATTVLSRPAEGRWYVLSQAPESWYCTGICRRI